MTKLPRRRAASISVDSSAGYVAAERGGREAFPTRTGIESTGPFRRAWAWIGVGGRTPDEVGPPRRVPWSVGRALR